MAYFKNLSLVFSIGFKTNSLWLQAFQVWPKSYEHYFEFFREIFTLNLQKLQIFEV